MPKFRKKPVLIEARQFTGKNWGDLLAWADEHGELMSGSLTLIAIPSREGTMRAEPGDWIIKGEENEFYPCKPEIFAATYEPA